MTIALGTYEPPKVTITMASPAFPGTIEVIVQALEVMAGSAIGSCRLTFAKHYCDGATVVIGSTASVTLGARMIFRGQVVAGPYSVTEDDDVAEIMLVDDKFGLEEFSIGQIGIGTQGEDGEDGFQDAGYDLVFNRKGIPNKDTATLDFNLGSTSVAWTLKDMLEFIFTYYVRADVATLETDDLSANYLQEVSNVDVQGKTALQAIDHIVSLAGESWALKPGATASTFVPVLPAAGTARTIKVFGPQSVSSVTSADEYTPSSYSIRKDASEVRDVHQVVSGWSIKETTYSKANGLLDLQAAFSDKKFFAQFAVDVTAYSANGLGGNLTVGATPKKWLADLVTRRASDHSDYLTAAEIAADPRLRLAKRADPALWVSATGSIDDAKLVTGGYQVDRKNGTINLEKTLTVRNDGSADGDTKLSIEEVIADLGIWYTVATRLNTATSVESSATQTFLPNPRTEFVRRTDLVPEARENSYLPDLDGENNAMELLSETEELYLDVTDDLSEVALGLVQASAKIESVIDLAFGFLPTIWLGDRIKISGRSIGASGDEVVRKISYDLQDMACEVNASDAIASMEAEKDVLGGGWHVSSVNDIERQFQILRDRVDDLEKLQDQRVYFPNRATDTDDTFLWKLTFLGGANVRIGVGEVQHSSRAIIDVASKDVAIAADHEYVWVQYVMGSGVATIQGPSPARPTPDSASGTFRAWLYRFRLIDGVASLETRGFVGVISIPGAYA